MKRFAIGFAALWFALGATRVLAVTSAIRYATITGTASAPSGGECAQKAMPANALQLPAPA